MKIIKGKIKMDKNTNRFLKGILTGASWVMRIASAKKFAEHDNNADRLAHLGLHIGGEVLMNEMSKALDNDYQNELNKERLVQIESTDIEKNKETSE